MKIPKGLISGSMPWIAAAFSKYFYSEIPWGLSCAIGAVMGYAWSVRQDLTETRAQLADLRKMFLIADSELVRVSALTTEHDDKFSEIQQEMIRAFQEIEEIK